MLMKFKDLNHHQFYEGMMRMTKSHNDPYRKALFYLFGLTDTTRQHIRHLYDFDEQVIRLESLHQGWQTSSTIKLTRLAFNLYNGYVSEDYPDAARNYSPYFMFDTNLLPYFFEAIKLRYPEYATTQNYDSVIIPLGVADRYEEYGLEH